jgi:precorrin-8X/cobalt-precorrin-8 methylmutase
MMITTDYIRDGDAIYEKSFAIIRAEADLSRFSDEEADVAIRMIHACGQVEAARHFVFSPGFVPAARAALKAGAPILCDAQMVAHGVTHARLPANNEVICTLRDPRTPELAKEIGNTRSAAALELWRDRLEGAVVAIGNAPTALFHLLDMLAEGAPNPPPSSACRSASWARWNPRKRWPKAPMACPSPSCAAAWAAAP